MMKKKREKKKRENIHDESWRQVIVPSKSREERERDWSTLPTKHCYIVFSLGTRPTSPPVTGSTSPPFDRASLPPFAEVFRVLVMLLDFTNVSNKLWSGSF